MPKPSSSEPWQKVAAIMDAITCQLSESYSALFKTATPLRQMGEILEGLPSEQLRRAEVRSLVFELYLVELPRALQLATYNSWLMLEAAYGLRLVVMRGLCRGHEQAVLRVFEAFVQRCCNRPSCTRGAAEGAQDLGEVGMLDATVYLILTELAKEADHITELQLWEGVRALQVKLLLLDLCCDRKLGALRWRQSVGTLWVALHV